MQESESNVNHGEVQDIPDEIKGWNWGAFSFHVWWGIGNKSYLTLLCLIPVFNIIWMFVCGFKGNEWAWINGDYTNVDSFKKVQQTWNLAGLVYFIVSLVMYAFLIYLLLKIKMTYGI